MHSRYYDPVVGRFINTDEPTILLFTNSNALGNNLYVYCGNNPVIYVDPTGDFIQYIIGAAIGGLLSLILYFVDCAIFHEKVIWWKALAAFGVGAASGALAATGVQLVGQVIGNVALSVGNLLIQGNCITETDIAIAIISGVILGLAGGAGLGYTAYLNSQDARLLNRIISSKGKDIAKAIVYFVKSNQTIYKKLFKPLLRSFVASVLTDYGGRATDYLVGE